MSDRELRRILTDIIDDVDAGRLRIRRPGRLVRWLGPPVLAASLGLGVAGCDDRALGYADDAGVQEVDSGTSEDYAAPPVDGGPVWAYGIPPIEDAGAPVSDGAVEVYDAEVNAELYGVPYDLQDAAVDPGNDSLYSAPSLPIDPEED